MDLIFETTVKKILDEHFLIFILTIAALLVTGFSYCILRVGSGNFIRTRVWKFFAGSHDFKDETFLKLWAEVVDVENVRFNTGIDFRSRVEVNRFYEWLNRYEIPIYQAMKVSKYFDVRRRYFIAHDFLRKSNHRLFAALIAAIFLVAVSAFYSSVRNNAYLTIIKSGFSFVYVGGYIEAYDKRIDLSFCDSFNKNEFDYLTSQNIQSMCELIVSDKNLDYYKSIIKKQRNFMFSILFLNIVMITFLIKSAYDYMRADEFKREYIESKLK